MKIKDITKINGREIITVGPNDTVSQAIDKLVNHRIGALPVCESDGKLMGIISERDILNGLHRRGKDITNARVRDLMTTDVIVGVPEDDLDQILTTMTEKGVRHIPVMAGPRVIGMLSIRDVIEERLTECHTQVRYLNDYIAGGYV
ncbi:MAG TPA: CBS domain-containing protein [Dehalococcoidales bacterium]|nr:CBS domain-containing protein [Dehalococcoidales bacterium]